MKIFRTINDGLDEMVGQEVSQAELEDLERNPAHPLLRDRPEKKSDGKPRDQLGRFTKLKKKGKSK